MQNPYIAGDTLDDLLRHVIEAVLSHGLEITPSRGAAKELNGVLLELRDPTARLSRTETKGKPFSCLGEFLWYMAGTNELPFIGYYLRDYKKYADGNYIYGGYGPRLFDWKGVDQVHRIIDILKTKPDSRQAVIQLFDAIDLSEEHKDIPCTCTLQFTIRNGSLNLFTYMRSNDVMIGLPHDFFSFTMLQEVVARYLSVQLGTYKHAVGSLHIYNYSLNNAKQYLEEGWQTTSPMPLMPTGNPSAGLQALLQAEHKIRNGEPYSTADLLGFDPYWADLVRLLLIYRSSMNRAPDEIVELRDAMSSPYYNAFINHRIGRLQ